MGQILIVVKVNISDPLYTVAVSQNRKEKRGGEMGGLGWTGIVVRGKEEDEELS